MVSSGTFETDFPIVAGHGGVGEVVDMGEEARKDGWKVGERVGALLNSGGCGNCGECRYYSKRYCSEASMLGLKGENGYEQAAPLTCAGVTIYSAIQKLDLAPGELLLVSGLGGLGSLGVQIAKAKGLKVIGADVKQHAHDYLLSLPQKFQLDLLLNPKYDKDQDLSLEMGALRNEGYDSFDGVDAAIICTDSPSAILMPYLYSDPTRIIGTLNGTRDQLKETTELCAREGIKSNILIERWDEGKGVERIMSGHGRGKGVVKM
ncbi:uncharacterized protein L199_002090 [Kwoniella botswanensis]|uniref:uncharacterized protein n=1 Tax=Kwoniella botswanensis TaxID=1268659 RepID=UPI00315C6110